MKALICVISLFGILCFSLDGDKISHRAAVYEHAVVLPKERKLPVNRSVALENMMKNIVIYGNQVKLAANQNVSIIVFPEDGIYGMGFSREAQEPYLEFIPDPEENWNACNFPEKYNNTEIQRHLSCFAKEASLYIVANMGDIQPCDPDDDVNCPEDEHYQFNTNVVYNPKGDLITKYHKINLFYEKQFDFPPDPKVVTFDTPFGKFALFTCFDILFKNPAVDSLLEEGVGNVAFPTAWMDALPLLAAVEFHSGFAAGAKVNLLAANINYPFRRFHGSGVYSPNGYAVFQYSENDGGRLLVGDLPITKTNSFHTKWNSPGVEVNESYISKTKHFHSDVFKDKFAFVQLSDSRGNISVCHKNLCCHLEYKKSEVQSEFYAFGAFDGLHTYEGTYYIQVCALLKCNGPTSCGEPTKEAVTYFTYLKINGTFGTQYIYPEVLLSSNSVLQLSSGSRWLYDKGILESQNGFEHPVISVALFARVYEKDLPLASKLNSCKSLNTWTIIRILMLICTTFLSNIEEKY